MSLAKVRYRKWGFVDLLRQKNNAHRGPGRSVGAIASASTFYQKRLLLPPCVCLFAFALLDSVDVVVRRCAAKHGSRRKTSLDLGSNSRFGPARSEELKVKSPSTELIPFEKLKTGDPGRGLRE